MLSKPHRLTEEKDFKRVMQKGRAFFVMELGLKTYPQKSREAPTRIGIVVPKKLARTIVKRNRIKRQLRHIFIPLIAKIRPGCDIICLARPALMETTYQKMQDQVHFALKKLGLFAD